VYWRGRLVTAINGTPMCCPDTPANLRKFRRGGGHLGGTGYPMIRMLALVACGTRTIIDATFGPSGIRETSYTRDLLRALHRGMIVLADRNFAAQALIAAIADTGAELLIRVKTGRNLSVCRRLRDGSYVSRIGRVEVRVICCEITIATSAGQQTGVYRLVTAILDPDCPAAEIIRLYHDRWEIETGAASPSPSTPPATSSSKPPASSPTPSSTSSAPSAAASWTTSCPIVDCGPTPASSNERSPSTSPATLAVMSEQAATRPPSTSTSAQVTLDNRTQRLTARLLGLVPAACPTRRP
jgi:hypothetical protein